MRKSLWLIMVCIGVVGFASCTQKKTNTTTPWGTSVDDPLAVEDGGESRFSRFYTHPTVLAGVLRRQRAAQGAGRLRDPTVPKRGHSVFDGALRRDLIAGIH